jgi:Flp pilus assembly protein TadD
MTKARFDQENTEDDFPNLLKRGTQLLQHGQVDEAVSVLEQAREIDGANSDVALNLSGAYILTKKFKKAVDILEPLSQQEPDNAMVWTNLGAAYLGNPILARDEEHLKAIAAFVKAIELNPTAPNVAYNLGLIYRDRKEYETAVQWFDIAIRTNPNDKDAQNIKARLEAKLEEEE